MRMYDIIEKKKRREQLTEEEIEFFVSGTVNGTIPDYQIAAFLMAVYFNSMTDAETSALTLAMARSGETADLSAVNGVTVDKHSTGGVGDKVTLIAAPIAAALGVKIAKMSGRGLGHTGGTLDKLEAVPGLSTLVSPKDFIRQVNERGIAIIGQSGNLAPADKKLYALRDVTATVDSVPLIASSIMSKKIASGSKRLVLDVKFGSGAFMKTAAEAEALAEKMIAIGRGASLKTRAVISSMEEPLGYAVGNAVETAEAAEVLKGGGPEDLKELSFTVAALMCSLASGTAYEECLPLCREAARNGSALEKLAEMVGAQGGDTKVIYDSSLFPAAKYRAEIRAGRDGRISRIDAEKTGVAAGVLGAGRTKKEDSVDYAAGIVFRKKSGDAVKKGETIAELFSNTGTQNAEEIMKTAVEISDKKPPKRRLIYKIL